MSEKSIRKGRRKAETRTRSQKKSDDAQPSTTDAVGSPCEEDQTSNSPTRPKSPEANCSICLGELQNKSFTDTCFHTFCFTCLLEWSKVKPVCPLCKQTFKSIIHNVRSIQDYDQYELRHANNNAAEETSRSFQYRTTLTQDRWLSRQQRDQARQLRLLERPSTLTTRSHWQRIRQTATSDFRRRVYAEGLRVQEAEQEPGRPRRERNITPEFFQRNPACTHRLVPWLNRELNVLLHNHEDHVQFLLELIIDLIKSYEIGGEVFRTHLDSILGHRTDHFVHEFIHFARSPYDMCRYDSSAVYHVNPREVDPLSVLTVDSSSDSDDDNNEEPDIFILSPTDPSVNSRDHSYFQRGLNPEPPAERRGYFSDISAPTPNPLISQVRGFLSSVDTADTAHSGWESPIPGPSSLYWSPPQPGSPTMNDISVIDQNGTDTTPDSIQVCTDMESISEIPQQPGPSNPGDSSSEDECLVTGFEKPFEERSPMLLSSEDDLETLMAKSRGKRAKKESDRRRKKDKRRSRTPLQYRVQSKSKSKSPPPPRRRRSTSRSRQGSRSQQRSKSRDRMRRSRSRSRSRYNSNVSNQRDRRRRSKSVDRRLQRSRSRDRSDRRRRSRSRSRGSERSGASRRNNRRSKSRSPVNRRKSRSRSRGEANFRRDGRRSRSRDRHAGRKQDRRNDERDRRRPRSESIEAVVRRLNNAQRGGQDSRGNRRSRDRRSRSRDRRSRSWDRRSRSRSRTRRSRSRDRRSQARRSEARGGRSRSPGRRSQARNRRSRSKDGRSDCKKSTSGHKKSENGEVKMPEIKIKLEPASWTVASPERLGPVSKKRRATGNDTLVSVDSTSRDTSIVELHLISHSTPQSVVTDDGSNTGLSNGPTTPNTKTLNDGQSVKQSTSSAATDKVKQSTSSAETDKVKQSTSSAATDKVKQSTSSAATDKVKQSTSSATTDKVKQSTSSVSSDKVKQSTSSSATDNNHCYTSRENHRSSANGEKRENLNGGGKKQSSSSSSKSRHSSDSRRSEKSATAKDKTNQSQSNAPSESSNPSQSGAAIDISLNCADRNVDLNELEKQMREKLTNRLKGGTDSHQDQSDKDVISKLF